jgi:hypothetical protein
MPARRLFGKYRGRVQVLKRSFDFAQRLPLHAEHENAHAFYLQSKARVVELRIVAGSRETLRRDHASHWGAPDRLAGAAGFFSENSTVWTGPPRARSTFLRFATRNFFTRAQTDWCGTRRESLSAESAMRFSAGVTNQRI